MTLTCKDHTSYQLLYVHPHSQRPGCDRAFYCLAKIRDTSSVDKPGSEKYRVSINLSIFESSKEECWYEGRVIGNPSFDITMSRYGDNKYYIKTKHFYVDTSWVKDRGLGKYMMIKILNHLKSKVDHNFVGELFFSLAASQGKDHKERTLRNYFYKSIGCTLKGHEDNPDAWSTVEHAHALINFDLLPKSWNEEKVEEISLEKGFQHLFSERNRLLQTIDKQNSSLDYHKGNTIILNKWKSRIEVFLIRATQLAFVFIIATSAIDWLKGNS